MHGDYPSSKQEKIVVRLPDGLRSRLAAIAKANLRSVNSEVVLCLTAFVAAHPSASTTVEAAHVG